MFVVQSVRRSLDALCLPLRAECGGLVVGEGLDPPLTSRCMTTQFGCKREEFVQFDANPVTKGSGRVKTLPYDIVCPVMADNGILVGVGEKWV